MAGAGAESCALLLADRSKQAAKNSIADLIVFLIITPKNGCKLLVLCKPIVRIALDLRSFQDFQLLDFRHWAFPPFRMAVFSPNGFPGSENSRMDKIPNACYGFVG
jgi:hypothetical protein